MSPKVPKWLAWAREIQALAQAGLTYSNNEYDLERYRRLVEIAAEMTAREMGDSKETILQSFQTQQGYATPKIDVRAGVIREGKILLVQERADGRWSMPGGWGDVGEAPSAMVEREALEESGFTVKAEKLVAIHDANHFEPLQFFHAFKLVFLCSIVSGEARPSFETPSVGFFEREKLPPLSNFRTSEGMIEEVFAHSDDPGRLPFFD